MNEKKVFLLILTGLLGLVSYLMVEPFLGYILGALLLSFVLNPLQEKLSGYIDERVSAFLVVTFGVAVAVIPVMLAGLAVVQDARGLAEDVEDNPAVNITELEQNLGEVTGTEFDIRKTIDSAVSGFTSSTIGSFSRVLGLATNLTVGLTLMFFLMYYLVKDGSKLAEWMKSIMPLPDSINEELYTKINSTTWAVMKGHVLIAFIQGLVAGAGLAVSGISNYIFWTFVMILLGFIPVIGTIIIWLPAAIYLYTIGHVNAALFLAAYGFVVVSLTDNILRPIIVDRKADIHPGAILIGVLGGVYLLGPAGLFIGPIIFGALKASVLVFKNNYEDL